jgi:FkbM family methyltransferase
MSSVYESLRESLLRLGPHHPALKLAIRAQARMNGFRLASTDHALVLTKDDREMLLPLSHYPQVPTAIYMWNLYFDTIEPAANGQREILDFSSPGLRRYKRTGVSLWAPGMAEDDTMEVYTAKYHPKAGDIVWDVGAHAGATVYFFAQMVGPTGRVYAFEPDDVSYEYLLKNIELHGLTNVVPVKKALFRSTGQIAFSMDGTQGAGVLGFSQCTDPKLTSMVETLSFEDACSEYGIPTYVKMDIEGAEVQAVESALPLLGKSRIHFAVESDHRVNGEFTTGPLCQLFTKAGYEATHSTEYGMQFMWGEPPTA